MDRPTPPPCRQAGRFYATAHEPLAVNGRPINAQFRSATSGYEMAIGASGYPYPGSEPYYQTAVCRFCGLTYTVLVDQK